MVKEMAYYCNIEDVAYFYHGDFCGSRAKSQTCLNYTEMQHSVRSQHLGSASWITDHDGDPVQHLQYLPYGEPYVDQRTIGYSERFRFTGKERDEETSYGYFGARYMDYSMMTMWLSVDPMADKYPGISPYNYCMWNPVKLIDPDGRDIDPSCLDDWNNQKAAIENKKNQLTETRDELSRDVQWWQFARRSRIKYLDERIKSLEGTLSTMGNLEGDHSTIYTMSHVEKDGSVNLVKEGDKAGMISINYSKTSSFVHEVTHAGQYYNNDIGFYENGTIAAYDIYDEVAAYKAALAYDPIAYKCHGKKMSMRQVTPEWVRTKSENYEVSMACGKHPVNIYSSPETIKKAGIDRFLGSHQSYLEIPSLIYRH